MGYSNRAMFAGVCEMAARAAVGFLLVPRFGFLAACFASPSAWIAADLFLIPSYLSIMRKLSRDESGAGTGAPAASNLLNPTEKQPSKRVLFFGKLHA